VRISRAYEAPLSEPPGVAEPEAVELTTIADAGGYVDVLAVASH
jgi:hypothetical protein